MNSKIYAAVLVGCALLQGCNNDTSKKTDSNGEDQAEIVSYAVGYNIGTTMAKQDKTISIEGIITGIKDGFKETTTPLYTTEEMQAAVMTYSQNMMAKMQQKQTEAAEKNENEGKAFLEANKAKTNVKQLESGLQYKIVKEGEGPMPTAEDTVTVKYTGKFINGEVFSSSDERGMPATFKVSQVIPAWTEALQKMPKGSVWELYVPPALAYGTQGASDVIGPNQTLLFTVELIDIKKDEKKNTEE